MANFGRCVLESQEVIGHLGRTRHFTSALQAQHKQIQHETVILRDERCKLQTSNDAVAVRVIHVLVVDDDVVLGCHVIGNVVIDDQAQQSIEQCQIDLFVELFKP